MPRPNPLTAELHCHTTHSPRFFGNLLYDSPMTVPEILDLCLSRHISILAVSDHDTLSGFRHAQTFIRQKHLPILLIPACEISSSEGHILAYGLTREIPQGLSAAETIRQIHAQKGLAVAAHPFFFFGLGPKILHLDFDLIEAYNATSPALSNFITSRLAKKTHKPVIAASDAHYFTEVGRATISLPASVKTVSQFLQHLKSGHFTLNRASMALSTLPKYLFYNLLQNFKPGTRDNSRSPVRPK